MRGSGNGGMGRNTQVEHCRAGKSSVSTFKTRSSIRTGRTPYPQEVTVAAFVATYAPGAVFRRFARRFRLRNEAGTALYSAHFGWRRVYCPKLKYHPQGDRYATTF